MFGPVLLIYLFIFLNVQHLQKLTESIIHPPSSSPSFNNSQSLLISTPTHVSHVRYFTEANWRQYIIYSIMSCYKVRLSKKNPKL